MFLVKPFNVFIFPKVWNDLRQLDWVDQKTFLVEYEVFTIHILYVTVKKIILKLIIEFSFLILYLNDIKNDQKFLSSLEVQLHE